MRRVGVVTATRADWGYLRPVCGAINASDALHGLLIACEVDHLGDTVPDAVVSGALPRGDSRRSMACAAGRALGGFALVLESLELDVVVVLGDRAEALAAALAAAYLGIEVCHIHGGDVTNNGPDDIARDCISRTATIHCAATPGAASRLHRMAVAGRVVCTGSPSLDELMSPPLDAALVRERYGITAGPLGLFSMHPDLGSKRSPAALMLEALHEAEKQCLDSWVAVHPNSDAGGSVMREVLYEHVRGGRSVRWSLVDQLSRDEWVTLMHEAHVMVGNSSAIRLEAPAIGLPTVEIGTRQEGRHMAEPLDRPAAPVIAGLLAS